MQPLWPIFVLAVLPLTAPATEAKQPNIVIILVDDMGYGDPHCFNPQSKIATPNIDRLAREGMRFTDAHAPGPLCHPSRYGLMTGRYPFRTDISRWPKQPLIEKGQVTIASLLRDQGYHTAMVGKWHLGFREEWLRPAAAAAGRWIAGLTASSDCAPPRTSRLTFTFGETARSRRPPLTLPSIIRKAGRQLRVLSGGKAASLPAWN